MAKELTITISNEGELKIDANGFSGSKCLEETRKFLQSIAGDEIDIHKKMTPTVKEGIKIGGR